MNINKFVAPEFLFGYNSQAFLGKSIKNLGGKHVFIVSDPIVSKLPWFESILDQLIPLKLSHFLFTAVSENPKDMECHLGAHAYLSNGCDVILAVGGGSVMDAAKAIGILCKNPGHIADYEGVDEIRMPIPPLICMPTTAGSAAEISQFSIITNTKEHYKMAIVSKAIVPDLAIIDPELTLTKDFDLTVNAGIDVLAHAIESYSSNAASPFTQLHALESIRLVLNHLRPLSLDLKDRSHREGMLQASVQAGLSFSNASLGLIHAMAHALGGRYNLVHGQLNGQLIASVIHYNSQASQKTFPQLIEVFKSHLGSHANTLDQLVSEFIESIRPNEDLPPHVFVTREMEALLPYILNDPCIATNPRNVDPEGVRWLYEDIRQRQLKK